MSDDAKEVINLLRKAIEEAKKQLKKENPQVKFGTDFSEEAMSEEFFFFAEDEFWNDL